MVHSGGLIALPCFALPCLCLFQPRGISVPSRLLSRCGGPPRGAPLPGQLLPPAQAACTGSPQQICAAPPSPCLQRDFARVGAAARSELLPAWRKEQVAAAAEAAPGLAAAQLFVKPIVELPEAVDVQPGKRIGF